MAALVPERVTFWFGCNMLRHGELIRLSIALLERIGIAVDPVGGLGYCCGVPKDGNLTASNSMGKRSSERLAAKGNEQVVTWCPSCHIQLDDFIAPAHSLPFEYAHIVSLLHSHREKLRPFLTHEVRRRGSLHMHSGFEPRTPVNAMVMDLLQMLPGYDIRQSRYIAPGHMCSPLSAVPPALKDVVQNAVADSADVDDLVTIFHSCHRELVAIERHSKTRVVNYIQLLAEGLGLQYADSYKAWRTAENPRDLIDQDRIDAVGQDIFDRAVLPELRR
jgi:hypothetical protein